MIGIRILGSSIVGTALSHRGLARPFIVLAAAMVLAACPQAAKTPPELSFGTEGLMVADVPTLTTGMQMAPVTLPEAEGGSGTLSYSVKPAVPGLSFDPTTRVLSGAPTVAGTYPLTYTAMTSDGDEASLDFTVKVVSSLIGTWQNVDTYTDDDGERETRTTTLTFTTSRFIVLNILSRGGVAIDDWSENGTWTSTDTTVTRTWIEEVPMEVVKDYHWGDAERNTLLVHHWEWGEPATSFERYTRLADPIPGGLTGTWTHRGTWDDDELGEVQQTLTYTITADTFTEVDRNEYPNGDIEINTRVGGLTIDRDKQFLKVAVTSASLEWNGDPDEDFDDTRWVGHEFRYGYAAAGEPDKLSISPRWDEQVWNNETMMWENNEELPYGNYWRLFTRSQEAR
ncbi:MAG: Ig domain-containing protein [Spirochaetaceae bacterium]|nr:Ig domain-containing protein [Spirochaetaceae bacterium]